MNLLQAEYIWLDGAAPVQKLRSKTRIVDISKDKPIAIEDFPGWSFDGSSTYQAGGGYARPMGISDRLSRA